jgi:hypothetical protein
MKPRIEKKLSKKLAGILVNVHGFTPKKVWIDNEYSCNRFPIHFWQDNPSGLTSKQKRQNFQHMGVRLDNMPSIGGGLDYWGEGEDWQSVFYVACDFLLWEMFPPTWVSEQQDPDDIGCGFTWPDSKGPLTGRRVINLARRYVNGERQIKPMENAA